MPAVASGQIFSLPKLRLETHKGSTILMKRYLPFVIIGAVLVLAVGAGALMFRSSQSQSQSPTPTPALTSGSPQGAPAAKGIVTVEEFGDYQCPPFGMVYPMLKKLKSEFGPRMRFIFYQ